MSGPINLVAGVDTSTQATKVVVVDPEDGRVVALGRAPHKVTCSDGARETDPEIWWRALHTALDQTARAGDVSAISVAGQQHGLVALDDDRSPVRPAILWNDTRSATEARELNERARRRRGVGRAHRAGAGGLLHGDSMGLAAPARADGGRRHPCGASTSRLRDRRLCGRGATDRGDASGTAWWSTRDEAYAVEVLDLIDLDPALLPAVLGPREPAGELTAARSAQARNERGNAGRPGTGDNMAAALGLGAAPGEPVVSLGTSGTAYAVMEERAVDPTGTVAGFADASGRFLPLAATLNATLAVDRVADWLDLDREAAAERTTAVVLPYLDGERHPNLPRAAGMIAGLRHATTREEILLAAYEGAAASLRGGPRPARRAGRRARPGRTAPAGGRRRPGQGLAERGGPALRPAGARARRRGAGRPGRRRPGHGLPFGEAPDEVARRWGTRGGITVEPPGERDVETLSRIRGTRDAALGLLEG